MPPHPQRAESAQIAPVAIRVRIASICRPYRPREGPVNT